MAGLPGGEPGSAALESFEARFCSWAEPGDDDAGTASSPWTVFDGKGWHMFYVGSRTTSPPPNRIPAVPYFTLAAKSLHPDGPWVKQRDVVPLQTKSGTYFADTASPGTDRTTG